MTKYWLDYQQHQGFMFRIMLNSKVHQKKLEIDSDLIFQEIVNNEIKFDTIGIFVK